MFTAVSFAVFSLLIHALLYLWRSTPTIRGTSVVFSHLIAGGSILGYIAIALNAYDQELGASTVCWLVPLLLDLSVTIIQKEEETGERKRATRKPEILCVYNRSCPLCPVLFCSAGHLPFGSV